MSASTRTVVLIAFGAGATAIGTSHLSWPWAAVGCALATGIALMVAPKAVRAQGAPLFLSLALVAVVGLAAELTGKV